MHSRGWIEVPPDRRLGPVGDGADFGRYAGWSLGEVARSDMEYVEWLDRARSAGTTARRSTRSCARAAGASRPMRARRTAFRRR
jgi:hypothetical protein